jgi:hypothetical protein
MKKVILAIVTMMSLTANSQMTVSEDRTERLKISTTRAQTISMFISDTDTSYAFYYKNYKYKTIVNLQYFTIADKVEALALMDLIEGVILNKKEYTITLTSGEVILLKRAMGTCEIFSTKGYTYFDKKNISKVREFLNK